jgi:hypothetical protein
MRIEAFWQPMLAGKPAALRDLAAISASALRRQQKIIRHRSCSLYSKNNRRSVYNMLKLYSAAGAAGSGLSSAIVVPLVMLIGVLTAVTGLVLGLGRWKSRHGNIRRPANSLRAEDHNRTAANSPSPS